MKEFMKLFLFEGELHITKQPFSFEAEAIDRKHAIAYVEVCYPTFKWTLITELHHKTLLKQ